MANDLRFSRALTAAMVAAPATPERTLIDVTRAVLHAGDEYVIDNEAAVFLHDAPADLARPARRPTDLDDVCGGDAIWNEADDVFETAAAFPLTAPGEDALVACDGGTVLRFDAGQQVPVAIDLWAAEAWNARRAAEVVELAEPAPSDLALLDIQHPDSDADARRWDQGEVA